MRYHQKRNQYKTEQRAEVVPVVVVDNSKTELSREYIRLLNATPQVDVIATGEDYPQAQELMKMDEVAGTQITVQQPGWGEIPPFQAGSGRSALASNRPTLPASPYDVVCRLFAFPAGIDPADIRLAGYR